MERSWQPVWRRSVERGIFRNGCSSGCQFGPTAGNRHGDRSVGWRSASSQKALSATRMVPVLYHSYQPCGNCRDDGSFIQRSCAPQDSSEAGEGLLCAGDYACGAQNRNRTCRNLYLVVSGYEHFAGKSSHDRLQGLDANCVGALVGCVLVRISNVFPLVHSAFILEMNFERGL